MNLGKLNRAATYSHTRSDSLRTPCPECAPILTPRVGPGCDQDWPSSDDVYERSELEGGTWHSHAVWWRPSTWGTGHTVRNLNRDRTESMTEPCRCCGGFHPYQFTQVALGDEAVKRLRAAWLRPSVDQKPMKIEGDDRCGHLFCVPDEPRQRSIVVACRHPRGHTGDHRPVEEEPVEQKPSQGRVVIFVERDYASATSSDEVKLATWPATVVLVHDDGRVGLDVTKPFGMHEWQEAVPHSETPVEKSWHWPPRV